MYVAFVICVFTAPLGPTSLQFGGHLLLCGLQRGGGFALALGSWHWHMSYVDTVLVQLLAIEQPVSAPVLCSRPRNMSIGRQKVCTHFL
jgi:hypothetical protein